MFIYRHDSDAVYLLMYVNDIVLSLSTSALLHQIITTLHHEFEMKDLGPLYHFLGNVVNHRSNGLFLQQRQYN
jgi:hypothetical protein